MSDEELPSDPNASRRSISEQPSHRIRRRPRLERVIQQVVRETKIFSGPLPPPDMLAAYNQVFPGCAERIVTMAEKEQGHRHQTESTDLTGTIALARRGQLIGAVLASIALFGGIYLVANDKDIQGFSLILGDVLLFGGAFVYDRFRKRPDTTQGEEDDETAPQQLPSSSPNPLTSK